MKLSKALLVDFILMDFPMHVNRISMEFPIMYFKGSQIRIPIL